MAMFDDPKKELEKLQEQLLKEEDWFDSELAEAKALLGEEPAPKKKKPQQTGNSPKTTGTKTTAARTTGTRQSADTKTGKTAKSAPPKVRNLENYDVNLDEYSEKVSKPGKSNKGLIILACLETAGIVGVVAYWLLFLL